MYPGADTYWIEPTGQVQHSLRRYAHSTDKPCPGGYHNASVAVGIVDTAPATAHDDDPRWPTACTDCGYVFVDDDAWQDFTETVYATPDGTLVVLPGRRHAAGSLPSAAPGAMWDAHWMGDWSRGADGISLAVALPNGRTWLVDSRASNCTRPDDTAHKCWVRHGDPRTGTVHVDKDGVTCEAGAGSIAADDYHGFLHHGRLTEG